MWDLAIDAYSLAIQAHPSNPRFYEFRAVCFVETGQLERGLADCAQGLSLNPGQGLYSLRSGIYYSMADYARAKEDTRKCWSFRRVIRALISDWDRFITRIRTRMRHWSL